MIIETSQPLKEIDQSPRKHTVIPKTPYFTHWKIPKKYIQNTDLIKNYVMCWKLHKFDAISG